jgi:two-component system alkaline phosphatase synthesis response regulator PhoP
VTVGDSTATTFKRTIVVVDDDRDIRMILRANLEDEGYAVLEAGGGREALEIIKESDPDLVVLDIMMPEVDGYDVLQELRSTPEFADLPVVLLTARRQESDVWEGWSAGADYYITKPFKMDELLKFIRYIFGED